MEKTIVDANMQTLFTVVEAPLKVSNVYCANGFSCTSTIVVTIAKERNRTLQLIKTILTAVKWFCSVF